ncbi:hypothetical protein AB0N06_30145 [Streptomyces sp. NPDC051020]|uniref:hypothetical protein n=1 Tax=Streptomyces sp. NPDC051020 TaxID=3155409 RepID=UPI00343D4752
MIDTQQQGQEPIDDGTASISRAQQLRPSVPLYRHMLYGSGLSHTVDFVVLMHIHFMCEDGKDFTVNELVDVLRAEGIRNANGKGDGLIGSKAVYESVARLRAAGFLHRSQENGGNFGKVSYTFYEFPAQDPNWNPPTLPGSTPNLPVPLTGEALPVGNHVSAGQTASPVKGSADRGSADRRTGKRRVSAGQTASPHKRSGKPSPPHPPEEEDSSSPNPLTRTKRSLPSQREEGREFTPEELAAARDFLQRMQRWQAGLSTARKCAPRLLRAMRTQGWPALTDMDDAQRLALEAEIFKNTGGAASWVKCLPGWVDDLCLYRKPTPVTATTAGSVPQDLAALRAACPACDQYGWVLDDDDDGPNRRCTHPGITADTAKEQQ